MILLIILIKLLVSILTIRRTPKSEDKMIDARELRIGNLVKGDETKEGRFEFIGVNNIHLTDFMSPIPLTIDWLNSFSFIRQGARNMWVNGLVSVVWESHINVPGEVADIRFYLGFKDMGNVIYHTQIECPYVHTLQNAFALTGEELELKQDK